MTNWIEAATAQYVEEFPKAYGVDYTDAVSLILPNLVNGCSWGLRSFKAMSSGEKKSIQAWANVPDIQVFQLKDGLLVNTDFMTLIQRIQQTVPIFRQESLVAAEAQRQAAVKHLTNWMTKLAKTPTKEALVGVFCTNDTSKVTINGTVYNAYNMDLVTFAQIVEQAGFSVIIEGRPVNSATIASNLPGVLQYLPLAPSLNAVMVQIARP